MKKHYATRGTRGFPLCGAEPSLPFLPTKRAKDVTCLRCKKRLKKQPRVLSSWMKGKTQSRKVGKVPRWVVARLPHPNSVAARMILIRGNPWAGCQ